MQALLRPDFRPERWSEADLDAAADHWLWLFERAATTATRSADHRTELRLRGFPRAATDAVAATLAARLPDADITRPDADTLAAVGRAIVMDAAPPPGLGVPRLAGPPFDGLYAEVRFTATARKRSGKPVAAGTLVLAGELGPDGFTVYAVWGEAGSAAANLQALNTPWADKEAWRDDLDEFRRGKRVKARPNALADRSFPKSRSVRYNNASVWLVSFPFTGERRRVRLLARVAVDLALIVLVAGFTWMLPSPDSLIVAWKLLLLFVFALPLWYLLVQVAKSWVMIRRYMTSAYATLYASPDLLIPADAAVAASYFDNPFGRKVAAEWAAAGYRLLGDATQENLHLRDAGYRLLSNADGTATVVLVAAKFVPNRDGTILFHYWPAGVAAMVVTRYADGSAAATMNGSGSLFRRKLYGPEFVARVCPGLTDPTELMAKHAELCRGHASRIGQSPLPVTKFEEFVRWNLEHGEEERRLYAANPVTWSDAFVLLMGYVRRAYR